MSLIATSIRRSVLVVEDDYLTAQHVCRLVEDAGADVAGPIGRLEQGLALIAEQPIDAAVLDINLHGSKSFKLCDELGRRGVPFMFLTGYDEPSILPADLRHAPFLSKPVDPIEFSRTLTSMAAPSKPPRGSCGNAVLDSLNGDDWRALEPSLERVSLAPGKLLSHADCAISYVYFPVAGLVSVAVSPSADQRVDVMMVGRDGAVGLGVILDDCRPGGMEAEVHVAGEAWRIAAERLMPLLSRRSLHLHLTRQIKNQIQQISFTALSAATGTTEQRVARWLAIAARRSGLSTIGITHEQIATALAVRRASVTVALHMLEYRQIIRSRRGVVTILNPGALEAQAVSSLID